MTKTLPLNIIYGIENEVDRVINTLKRLPWYKEQEYSESFAKLPKGVTGDLDLKDIETIINVEFDCQKYEEYKNYIESEWGNLSSQLMKLKEISAFNLNNHYTLILTRYGSGGSYDSKQGLVISNIDFRSKDEIMGTIIHEIIHIGIQHLIDRYNVRHWYKERLVDLLVDRFFPGLKNMQNIKDDTKTVDEAFANHFPELEKVISAIGD
jgi:hypothetical protein